MTRIVSKKPSPKKCRNTACRAEFVPARPLQTACSVGCAIALTQTQKARESRNQAKQERAARRAARERIKTKGDYMRETQAVINRYVRLRDAHRGCVSCDKPADWAGQWHASHFRSRGAAPHLRFHLHNIHKACSICNNHLSGNIMGYRPELVRRIGADRVGQLEASQERASFTIDYLKRLKKVFSRKVRLTEARLK
ncbi:recombination protein NinG [Stutzerimonas nitrititolerans]|uniref:recombination protein NinG n=1 Tax=Stutzerimonas nitrititolerans TaxID=2482751 RepID=UPI00289EEDBF|nr:recombination protein NinG [Stutzerimonas nitrititolerans]